MWGNFQRLTALGIFLSLPLLAEPSPYPLTIVGHDGFVFVKVTDSNGHDVLSLDKSPMYEGVLEKKNPPPSPSTKILLRMTYKTMEERGYIAGEAGKPFQYSAWAPNAVKIRVPISALVNLLGYYQNSPDSFFHLFRSTTHEKTQLLGSLLFGNDLSLSAHDLEVLQREAFEPQPAPVNVPILVQNLSVPIREIPYIRRIWGVKHLRTEINAAKVADFINDIQVGHLQMKFKSKSVDIDPSNDLIRIRLIVDKATLRGVIHQLGRPKEIFPYKDNVQGGFFRLVNSLLESFDKPTLDKLLQFYEQEKVLIGGDLGGTLEGETWQIRLSFGIQIVHEPSGYWKINLKEPLTVTPERLGISPNDKTNSKPKVVLKFVPKNLIGPNGEILYTQDDIKKPLIIDLSEKVLGDIRRTLNETLQQGFKSNLAPEDLGFFIPMGPGPYEDQSGKVALESRLETLDFEKDELVLGYGFRLQVAKSADCIKKFDPATLNSLKPLEPDDRKEVQTSKDIWTLESQVPLSQWTTSRQTPLDLNLSASSSLATLINAGAYASGIYCITTKTLWPREGFFPYVGFNPSALPKLSLDLNKLDLDFEGQLMSFERNFRKNSTAIGEKFDLVTSQGVASYAEAALDSKSDTFAVDLGPVRGTNFSDEENSFLSSLGKIMKSILVTSDIKPAEGIVSPKEKTHLFELSIPELEDNFSIRDAQNNLVKKLLFKSIRWNSDRIDLLADPTDFAWIEKIYAAASKESEKIYIPNTILDPELLGYSRFAPVTIRWKDETEPDFGNAKSETGNFFYSWRLLDCDSNMTDDWSVFKMTRETRVYPKKEGCYRFQIKGMNRSFKIESEPKVYEFKYLADERPIVTPITGGLKPAPLPATEPAKPANAEHEPSKGGFGCVLRPDTLPEGILVNLILLLMTAFAYFRYRRY